MARKLRIVAITLVLLFFFQVPLGFIAYGGAAGVLFALLLLTPLIVLQVLVLKAMQKKFGLTAASTGSNAEEWNHETHEGDEVKDQSPLINAD